MHTLSFLFFLFLTSSVSAQQSIVHSDTSVRIVRERYTLNCPASWTVDTSKTFGMDVLLRSPKTDSLDDFRENMNVFVQDLHGQNYSLSKIGTESEEQIKNMVTGVEILESKLSGTTSSPYYILKYKGRQGKYMLTVIQHYYFKDEVGYALTFTIKNGEEVRFARLADAILSSFRLH